MFPILLSLDRNECEDGSAKCPVNAVCSNTAGSYSCRCVEGYTLNEQGLCAGENERTSVLCICKENGEVLQRVRNLELTF